MLSTGTKSTDPEARQSKGRTKTAVRAKAAPRRREQQRSVDTRLTIIRAALAEFAEKGFDGASMRMIGDRAKMQHPLITYHFSTKYVLWQAVAEHIFTQIGELWVNNVPDDAPMSARDQVREEIRQLYRVQREYPEFHHFMLRESSPGNVRLEWLAGTFLRPLHDRLLKHITAAQAAGDLPPADPTLVRYLLTTMVSALTAVSAEIQVLSGIDTADEKVADEYWQLIERVIFPTPFGR